MTCTTSLIAVCTKVGVADFSDIFFDRWVVLFCSHFRPVSPINMCTVIHPTLTCPRFHPMLSNGSITMCHFRQASNARTSSVHHPHSTECTITSHRPFQGGKGPNTHYDGQPAGRGRARERSARWLEPRTERLHVADSRESEFLVWRLYFCMYIARLPPSVLLLFNPCASLFRSSKT